MPPAALQPPRRRSRPGGCACGWGCTRASLRLTKEGYVGLDVHTAARIAGCAHGGQVVLSRRTRELLADVAVTDLGDHRLKDIAEPLRLFQLGDDRFPPLRSLSPTTLPQPVSTFVGRERELGAAAEALAGARVLTVTGPGGVGKTRFAIALARAALDALPRRRLVGTAGRAARPGDGRHQHRTRGRRRRPGAVGTPVGGRCSCSTTSST